MKVVNLRNLTDAQLEITVYVGRNGDHHQKRWPFARHLDVLGSKFYSQSDTTLGLGMTKCLTKPQAVAAYRSRLWMRINSLDVQVLEALASIKPHELVGCWCAPNECHADAIVAAIRKMNLWLTKPPTHLNQAQRAAWAELRHHHKETL